MTWQDFSRHFLYSRGDYVFNNLFFPKLYFSPLFTYICLMLKMRFNSRLPPLPPFLAWTPTFQSYICLFSCYEVLVIINPPALKFLIAWHQLYNDKMGLGPCYPCNNSGYYYYSFFCGFFAARNKKISRLLFKIVQN